MLNLDTARRTTWPPPGGHGPLYEVRVGHGLPPSYVLSSFPEVPPAFLASTWLGGEILQRVAMVYVDVDPRNAGALLPTILTEETWVRDVPPALVDLAAEATSAVGLSPALLTLVSPLTLALVLQHRALGFGDLSVAHHIVDLAESCGKPIIELDRPEDLVAALASVPRSEQLALLRWAARLCFLGHDARQQSADEARRSYLDGHVELSAGLHRLATLAPSAQEHLVHARTERWIEVIVEAMARAPILVCIGPEHLAGEHGLLEGVTRGPKARGPDDQWICHLAWGAAP